MLALCITYTKVCPGFRGIYPIIWTCPMLGIQWGLASSWQGLIKRLECFVLLKHTHTDPLSS